MGLGFSGSEGGYLQKINESVVSHEESLVRGRMSGQIASIIEKQKSPHSSQENRVKGPGLVYIGRPHR